MSGNDRTADEINYSVDIMPVGKMTFDRMAFGQVFSNTVLKNPTGCWLKTLLQKYQLKVKKKFLQLLKYLTLSSFLISDKFVLKE